MARKAKKNNEEQLKEDINTETEEETDNSEKVNSDELDKESVSEETENDNQEKNQNNTEEEEKLQNKILRLQADFLNYKTRTEKEKTSTYSNAIADTICALLPVLDNLERALEAEETEGNSFKEGVEMIYTQLIGILEKKGLKEIEALHKPFDPNIHYGVAFEECDDVEDDTVIEVLQKGFTVNDKVIRPSMVKICKK